ncbi:MAG: DNA-binding response regulator [Pirellulaceae bacterium]|nr:MAG: DNA-binding response regulator [Pirellulaceae bacterium]
MFPESLHGLIPVPSSERVLVVVPSPSQRVSIIRCLSEHGIAAEPFGTPEAAIGSVTPTDVGCLAVEVANEVSELMRIAHRLSQRQASLEMVAWAKQTHGHEAFKMRIPAIATFLTARPAMRELVKLIREAVSESIRQYTLRKRAELARQLLARLTAAESKILELAAEGLPNKAICVRLDVSSRTVERRRNTALKKLGIRSIAEYAALRAWDESLKDWSERQPRRSAEFSG